MSTLEDKLAAGIENVRNTSRARKTPVKAVAAASIPAASNADGLPIVLAESVKVTSPVVTSAATPVSPQIAPIVVVEVPKRVYLTDDRVWPD